LRVAESVNKNLDHKQTRSHCSDTGGGGLPSLIDALDEFPLFPAPVPDYDPISDSLQVGRNPRVVSSFDEVVETRLEFLDDPSEDFREAFDECAQRFTYSSSPRIAATVITSVLSFVVLGCSPAGYSKPKRFTRGRNTCCMEGLMKRATEGMGAGHSPSRNHW